MARMLPITKVVYVERTSPRPFMRASGMLIVAAGSGVIWALIVTVIWLILEGL